MERTDDGREGDKRAAPAGGRRQAIVSPPMVATPDAAPLGQASLRTSSRRW